MNQRTGVRPSLLRSGVLPGLVALGLLLSACGSSEPETASEATPTSSAAPSEPAESDESSEAPTVAPTETETETEPECSQVWVAGEEMPNPYKGCFDGASFVKAESQRCAFGAKLFTYDDRFYAAQFNKINETDGLAEDPAYQKALDSCGG